MFFFYCFFFCYWRVGIFVYLCTLHETYFTYPSSFIVHYYNTSGWNIDDPVMFDLRTTNSCCFQDVSRAIFFHGRGNVPCYPLS